MSASAEAHRGTGRAGRRGGAVPPSAKVKTELVFGLGGESAIQCGVEMSLPYGLIAEHRHERCEHEDH
jgi:hypothetical protein